MQENRGEQANSAGGERTLVPPAFGNCFIREQNVKKKERNRKQPLSLLGQSYPYRFGYQPLRAYRRSLSSPEREKEGPYPFLGP